MVLVPNVGRTMRGTQADTLRHPRLPGILCHAILPSRITTESLEPEDKKDSEPSTCGWTLPLPLPHVKLRVKRCSFFLWRDPRSKGRNIKSPKLVKSSSSFPYKVGPQEITTKILSSERGQMLRYKYLRRGGWKLKIPVKLIYCFSDTEN